MDMSFSALPPACTGGCALPTLDHSQAGRVLRTPSLGRTEAATAWASALSCTLPAKQLSCTCTLLSPGSS